MAASDAHRGRIAWFADLEALAGDLDILERLRDEIALTTVVPESHLSHTSGFRASELSARSSPLRDWAERPGLREHHAIFGTPEDAMAVLPGIVGGVDDRLLLAVIERCRRLGIEVWGHAGLWSYGAELFPELAAVDVLGRSVLPASLPWGTPFCPSRPELDEWLVRSLCEATVGYDLDGWFMDHARYPTPAFGQGLLACACEHCAPEMRRLGLEIGDVARDVRSIAQAVRRLRPEDVAALAEGGAVPLLGWLSRWPALMRWFDVRAALLAGRFARVVAAIQSAVPRFQEVGCDVFPPGVALLAGHDHARWIESVTYLAGGFTEPIGWGSVGRVTARSLGDALAEMVAGLDREAARAAVARFIGAGDADARVTDEARLWTEMERIAIEPRPVPVYPPIAQLGTPYALERTCGRIVDLGLDGAMIAGLETATPAHLRVLRRSLAGRLPL